MLDQGGIKYIALTALALLLGCIIFFTSAGTINIIRPWIYFAIAFLYLIIFYILFAFYNPALLNARGYRNKDVKRWDTILTSLYTAFVFISHILMGLDTGRYNWSTLNEYFLIAGIILFIASLIFGTWPMLVNPHFETFSRIQKDRGHQVITAGPYRIIRHPGYLAVIFSNIAAPCIIGSAWGFLPTGAASITFIIRTYLEDIMLTEELKGYAEYAALVKWKLIPGIW